MQNIVSNLVKNSKIECGHTRAVNAWTLNWMHVPSQLQHEFYEHGNPLYQAWFITSLGIQVSGWLYLLLDAGIKRCWLGNRWSERELVVDAVLAVVLARIISYFWDVRVDCMKKDNRILSMLVVEDGIHRFINLIRETWQHGNNL